MKRNLPTQRKGIAMVITLSILVLLTVALSKTFQDTALEIKMVKHEENLFMIKQINRSFFRAFLIAIKTFGANKAQRFISEVIPPDVPVPISGDEDAQDGYLMNPTIISLDHFYRVNTSAYDRDAGAVNRNILINIFSKINVDNPPPVSSYNALIGSIADFIDQDETEISKHFLIGQETYFNQKVDFNTKNNDFDILTELRILPKIREINYPQSALRSLNLPLRLNKLPFEECEIGRFNLNFLPRTESGIKEALYSFSSMFENINSDGNCIYEAVADKNNIDVIIELAKDKLGVEKTEGDLFKNPLSQDEDWKEAISSLFVQGALSTFITFFSGRSELIKIDYEILYGLFRVKNEAIIQLTYGPSDSDIPDTIDVMYFKSE